MKWIQFFSDIFDRIIAFWKDLDVFWGVFLIWVFGLILFNVLIPAIKNILFLPRRRKERNTVLSYCNRNLKAHSFFLDHAAGAYVIAESSLSIDNEKNVERGADIINVLSIESSTVFNESFSIPKCYGVSFFSHNRLQAIEADEAHWFTIKLYNSDVITRSALRELFKLRQKSINPFNQAIEINSLYPYITSLRIAVNAYYEHLEKHYILLSQSNSFFLETEVSPSIYDGNGNFNTRLPLLFETAMSSLSINPIEDIIFTDIGFDPVNYCLYIIGQLPIKGTRTIRKQYTHKNINFVFKELDSIEKGHMSPKELLFIYSVANLRSRLYSK